jgi:hypothetical protein
VKIIAGIVIIAGGWFLMEGLTADPIMNKTTIAGAVVAVIGFLLSIAAYRPDRDDDNE